MWHPSGQNLEASPSSQTQVGPPCDQTNGPQNLGPRTLGPEGPLLCWEYGKS